MSNDIIGAENRVVGDHEDEPPTSLVLLMADRRPLDLKYVRNTLWIMGLCERDKEMQGALLARPNAPQVLITVDGA